MEFCNLIVRRLSVVCLRWELFLGIGLLAFETHVACRARLHLPAS